MSDHGPLGPWDSLLLAMDLGNEGEAEQACRTLVTARLQQLAQEATLDTTQFPGAIEEAIGRLLETFRSEQPLQPSTRDQVLTQVVWRVVWGRLVEKYREILVPWIRHQLPPPLRSDDEDIWQEVSRVMDRNCLRYEWKGERQFIGLLQRIATRQVWDRVRSHKAWQALWQPGDNALTVELPQEPVHHETPSCVAWRRQREHLLSVAIRDTLNPDEQTLVRLRFMEMLTVRETAAALNKSPGAVKMATQRLLVKLQQALKSSLGTSGR